MRSKKPRVWPNAAYPFGDEARILSRRHSAFGTKTTSEQELAGSFVGDFQIVVDCLAGLFAQFKSDWPSGLFLSDRSAVRRVSARSDIFDLDRNDVAATQLAVDRQIEHGEVPSATFDLEFRPDRPGVFGSQWRLCSGHLVLIPGHSLMGRGSRIQLILHGHTPRLGYRGEKYVPPD